jgi:hypothetical protein
MTFSMPRDCPNCQREQTIKRAQADKERAAKQEELNKVPPEVTGLGLYCPHCESRSLTPLRPTGTKLVILQCLDVDYDDYPSEPGCGYAYIANETEWRRLDDERNALHREDERANLGQLVDAFRARLREAGVRGLIQVGYTKTASDEDVTIERKWSAK